MVIEHFITNIPPKVSLIRILDDYYIEDTLTRQWGNIYPILCTRSSTFLSRNNNVLFWNDSILQGYRSEVKTR